MKADPKSLNVNVLARDGEGVVPEVASAGVGRTRGRVRDQGHATGRESAGDEERCTF